MSWLGDRGGQELRAVLSPRTLEEQNNKELLLHNA